MTYLQTITKSHRVFVITILGMKCGAEIDNDTQSP